MFYLNKLFYKFIDFNNNLNKGHFYVFTFLFMGFLMKGFPFMLFFIIQYFIFTFHFTLDTFSFFFHNYNNLSIYNLKFFMSVFYIYWNMVLVTEYIPKFFGTTFDMLGDSFTDVMESGMLEFDEYEQLMIVSVIFWFFLWGLGSFLDGWTLDIMVYFSIFSMYMYCYLELGLYFHFFPYFWAMLIILDVFSSLYSGLMVNIFHFIINGFFDVIYFMDHSWIFYPINITYTFKLFLVNLHDFMYFYKYVLVKSDVFFLFVSISFMIYSMYMFFFK